MLTLQLTSGLDFLNHIDFLLNKPGFHCTIFRRAGLVKTHSGIPEIYNYRYLFSGCKLNTVFHKYFQFFSRLGKQ